MLILILLITLLNQSNGFWDRGTTTPAPHRTDTSTRLSFFRWQRTEFHFLEGWLWWLDWIDIHNRRRLAIIAGLSIDFIPLSTGVILNRRIVLTSANYLDPYMNRQKDLRIWALGRTGLHITPYRYRVWSVWRVLPKSNNPEHKHGPRGLHVPRHDVAVIISWDQFYLYSTFSRRYMYATRGWLTKPHFKLYDRMVICGSGYEYLTHVYENYKIFYTNAYKTEIVDCSKYLPKWWGKFICVKNTRRLAGVQNGGPLMSVRNLYDSWLVGLGCFEIRYNEDRILVFTDLRYYTRLIHKYADIRPGQYYEYAYPQWGITLGFFYDGDYNYPFIQSKQIIDNLYPLGK